MITVNLNGLAKGKEFEKVDIRMLYVISNVLSVYGLSTYDVEVDIYKNMVIIQDIEYTKMTKFITFEKNNIVKVETRFEDKSQVITYNMNKDFNALWADISSITSNNYSI